MLCSDKDAGPELDLARAGLALYGELEARLGDEARIRRKGALIVHPEADTWAGEAARVGAGRDPGGAAAGSGRGARARAGADRRAVRRELLPGRPAVRSARDRAGARPRGRRGRRRGARGLRGRPPCRRPPSYSRNGEQVEGGRRGDRRGAVERGAGRGRRARRCRSSRARASSSGSPRPRPGLVRHKVVDGSYLRSVRCVRQRARGQHGRGDDVGGRRARRLVARAARLRHVASTPP